MASIKEGLVVILDIGKNTRQEFVENSKEKNFFDKQKKCCIELLQRKIFACKKDEIAFILMGTRETDNELNRTLDGYNNIIEGVSMEIPNWNMLISLMNPLENQRTSDNADWLDAVIVALDLLKREEAKRFKHLKIVLFHRFLSDVDESSVDIAIAGLKTLDVELVVISDNVQYIDTTPSITVGTFPDEPTTITSELAKRSQNLIKKVLNETNGALCNFDIAIPRILHALRPKSKPWFWYSNLEIGTKIKLQICVTIAIKEEKHFKWETESLYPEATCWRATEYFKNGDKFEPATEELLKGYMLGTTPIPYDESLGITSTPTEKGMKCIAFSHKNYIPPEYLCGSGTYLVLPKPGQFVSSEMMVALVKAMNKSDLVMIVRRVYNNGNRPKFVALFPNMEREYPCLTLFELFCSEQQLHWEFPPLKIKKTQPTPEQYQAIDELMESMDLETNETGDDNIDKPRNQYKKNIFSLKSLPNLTNEYICQLATERVLQNSKNITSSLQGRDTAFKVPEEIAQKSSKAIEKIKELFLLEEIKKDGKRELIRHLGDIPSQPSSSTTPTTTDLVIDNNNPLEYKLLNSVGTVTPAEDYTALVIRDVENESDDDNRKANFDRLSNEIRTIIHNLMFKSITKQYEKIRNAIKVYREQALFYNPYDYNDWMKEIKNIIISRKMYDFWEDVIVKDELGLLWAKNCDFFDDMDDPEPNEFYKIKTISSGDGTTGDGDGDNVEDLFNDM